MENKVLSDLKPANWTKDIVGGVFAFLAFFIVEFLVGGFIGKTVLCIAFELSGGIWVWLHFESVKKGYRAMFIILVSTLVGLVLKNPLLKQYRLEHPVAEIPMPSPTLKKPISTEEFERFESDFSVPIVVDLSSGMPVLVPGTIPGGRPEFFLGEGSKVDLRQRAFAGIAFAGIHAFTNNGIVLGGRLLIDKPQSDKEEEYCLELIEFAILREIQEPGAFGDWISSSFGGGQHIAKSGVSQKSPLTKSHRVASSEMLKLFPSNRFAIAFYSLDNEKHTHWFIPYGVKWGSRPIYLPNHNIKERIIVVDKPNIFHSEIKITPIGTVPGGIPSGFSLQHIPPSMVATRSYSIEMKYDFKINIKGNRELEEYKKWLDLIFENAKEHYSE